MARAGGQGEDLVAQEGEFAELEQGKLDDAYPINHQGSDDFQVGGVERSLPDELQLEQLVSYLEATYDTQAEQFLALLPDRITHASMLMLGSAVDHAMPGVAFPGDVAVSAHELGAVFTPSSPTGAWAISCYLGPRGAREHAWRPEVAGAAELSGTTILDLDLGAGGDGARGSGTVGSGTVGDGTAGDGSPASLVAAAINYARERGASSVAVWAFGDAADVIGDTAGQPGGAGAGAAADAVVLTHPTALPGPAASGKVPTLIQVATRDEVAPAGLAAEAAARVEAAGAGAGAGENAAPQVISYYSTHFIATPAESRRRVRDVAEFLSKLAHG